MMNPIHLRQRAAHLRDLAKSAPASTPVEDLYLLADEYDAAAAGVEDGSGYTFTASVNFPD